MANQDFSSLNLYKKINLIMSELSYLTKTSTIEAGKGRTYTAIQHDYVAEKTQPLLIKYGVVAVPRLISDEFKIFEVRSEYNGKEQIKNNFLHKVIIDVDFINSDNPAEKISVSSFAYGIDPMDKASGKALSMAVKYAYLKLLNIPTGDKEEERFEIDRIEKNIKENISLELRDILKANGKYDGSKTDIIIQKMSIDNIQKKIAEYRNKGE
jgi:hypothetical protein